MTFDKPERVLVLEMQGDPFEDEEPPPTERRPDLTKAWANVMNDVRECQCQK